MKYLGSYDNLSAYKAAKVTPPNVSLVEGKCYYKPIKHTWFGDIAYFDKKKEEFDFCSYNAYISSVYKDMTKVPIGVVAVPARYTPDNTNRIMSLLNMSCGTPDTGSGAVAGNTTTVSMKWGAYGAIKRADGTNLPYLSQVIYVNPLTGQPYVDPSTGKYRTSTWNRIPSSTTGFGGYVGSYPGTHYYYGASSGEEAWVEPEEGGIPTNTKFGPFPLLPDNNKNPLYFAEGMATNDFDGRGNTDAILYNASVINGLDWSGTIDAADSSTPGYCAPAFCCDRYHTHEGSTSAGDWYLPAEGELSFVTAFYDELYKSTLAIENVWGTDCCVRLGRSGSDYGYWLWSSSLYSSSSSRSVLLSSGNVGNYDRTDVTTGNRVRAFSAL